MAKYKCSKGIDENAEVRFKLLVIHINIGKKREENVSKHKGK